jgi:hypothetical protein
MRRLAEVLVLTLCVIETSAAVVRVEVPAHARWCHDMKVDVQQMTDPVSYEEALRRGIQPLEACAREKALRTMGIPWVASTSIDAAANPPTADITLCAIVAPGAESCAADLTKESVQKTAVLAAVCPEGDAERCRAELRAAMQAAPWNRDAAFISAVRWRTAQAARGDETAENIVAALTATDTHILRSETLTATAQAPPRAPYVVVAVDEPEVPAPQQ